jgi:hypothetical protein
LHINCAAPNGNVTVTVAPGGQTVTLRDNGAGADQAAGDGIYSGQWTTATPGSYTLAFPGGDVVTASVLANYNYAATPFAWRTITGFNLDFGDDAPALVLAPFPIRFGGGSFTAMFVSSNGTLNLTQHFATYDNGPLPTSAISTLVAPFWDDLYAFQGTNQNVFVAVTGSAPHRELVIEWRNVGRCCSGDPAATVKFQVVFFEGRSDILFNYADTIFGGGEAFADQGADATVGVQVATNAGAQFSFNTPSLSNNTALLWTVSTTATADATAAVTETTD